MAIAALALGILEFAVGRFWAQHFTAQLGFACLAVAAVCALSRLWLAAGAWAAVAVLALAPVVQVYLPRLSAPRPGCLVSVLNFNQEEYKPDIAGATQLIARLHPDILFAEKVFAVDDLRERLLAAGFASYHSASASTTLLLSRFPIRHSTDLRYGTAVEIEVEGREVHLINIYMTRPNRDRLQYVDEFARLRRRLVDERGPLILAGDGNTTIFTSEMRAIREILSDSWDEAGYGLGATFPGPVRRAGRFGPWLRIDYIMHDAGFDTVSARRITDAPGAGHYPVMAELALVGAGAPGTPCR